MEDFSVFDTLTRLSSPKAVDKILRRFLNVVGRTIGRCVGCSRHRRARKTRTDGRAATVSADGQALDDVDRSLTLTPTRNRAADSLTISATSPGVFAVRPPACQTAGGLWGSVRGCGMGRLGEECTCSRRRSVIPRTFRLNYNNLSILSITISHAHWATVVVYSESKAGFFSPPFSHMSADLYVVWHRSIVTRNALAAIVIT